MSRGAQKDVDVLLLLGKFVATVSGISSVQALRTALFDFLGACDIRMMSYHHLPPPGAADYTPQIAVAARGFPEEWVARYEREFVDVDPIPKRALTAVQSFYWSEAAQFEDLSPEEDNYLKELERANLGDGLAIPVFGPLGRNGYVGLGFGCDGTRPGVQISLLLRTACQLGHQEYCRLLFKELSGDVQLSAREIEILTWVSRGKSNAVIAQILGISGHTVDTHLRRAFGKLGVQDRVTAALRGAALGLL